LLQDGDTMFHDRTSDRHGARHALDGSRSAPNTRAGKRESP